MFPQYYFRMEHEIKTIVTMYMSELVFKDHRALVIQYDTNKNLPLIAGCCDENFTEVMGSLYKCGTDPTNLNLSFQENHIMK